MGRRSEFSQWYADRRWRAKRALQLQIEPLCQFCRERGLLKPADVADHIEPHKGDRERFWNGELQSLCHACHSGTKQRMERSGKLGCDVNGDPYMPGEHWR